jgi:hypothetical protein
MTRREAASQERPVVLGRVLQPVELRGSRRAPERHHRDNVDEGALWMSSLGATRPPVAVAARGCPPTVVVAEEERLGFGGRVRGGGGYLLGVIEVEERDLGLGGDDHASMLLGSGDGGGGRREYR